MAGLSMDNYTKQPKLHACTFTTIVLYTDEASCEEGSVTLVKSVEGDSLPQLVEMCSGEGVWSPVCGHNWTLADATVICMERGHTQGCF